MGVKTPIVALTANALESDKQLFFQAGIDDFQSKVNANILVHKLFLISIGHVWETLTNNDGTCFNIRRGFYFFIIVTWMMVLMMMMLL